MSDRSALQIAVVKEDKTLIELLLRNGAEVNAFNTFGSTPLFDALHNASLVQLLLNAGADVNPDDSPIDRIAVTPLQDAVYDGFSDTIRLLLNSGADATQPIETGDKAFSLLDEATVLGYETIVEMLIEHGADSTADPFAATCSAIGDSPS